MRIKANNYLKDRHTPAQDHRLAYLTGHTRLMNATLERKPADVQNVLSRR